MFPVVKAFRADNNGLYYLWYGMSVPCAEVYEGGEEDVYTALDRIYVKDSQMNTICYEQIPDSYGNQLVTLFFDEYGTPVLLAKDAEGYYTCRVRTKPGEEYRKERAEIEVDDWIGGQHLKLTQEGPLFLRDGAVYLFRTGEGREEKLLELSACGIYEEEIVALEKDEENLTIVCNSQADGKTKCLVFAPGERQQKEVTIGVMKLQPQLTKIITEFNRSQEEIRILPIAYAEGTDYETGYERLKLDIVRGEAPDLISTYGMDYEILIGKGIFEDLYAYMEGDSELSSDKIVNEVLKAYETDGNLYTMAPAFLIHSMWGGSSLIQGRYGVGTTELMQFLQEQGGDCNHIYGFSADESVLSALCSQDMNRFLDWKNGSCNFTSTEFAGMLEFAKSYHGPVFDSLYLAVREKEILLTLGQIASVEDYCLQNQIYGEVVEFIGCPTQSGTGTVAGFLGEELAINTKSRYREEAWEFLKYYLLNGYDGQGFPVVEEQLEAVLLQSMEEKQLVENGKSVPVAKKSYQEKDVVSILIYKSQQEDVAAIRDLIGRISGKFRYYSVILDIVEEESQYFFKRDKEIKEVTAIIQNRVALYLKSVQ